MVKAISSSASWHRWAPYRVHDKALRGVHGDCRPIAFGLSWGTSPKSNLRLERRWLCHNALSRHAWSSRSSALSEIVDIPFAFQRMLRCFYRNSIDVAFCFRCEDALLRWKELIKRRGLSWHLSNGRKRIVTRRQVGFSLNDKRRAAFTLRGSMRLIGGSLLFCKWWQIEWYDLVSMTLG